MDVLPAAPLVDDDAPTPVARAHRGPRVRRSVTMRPREQTSPTHGGDRTGSGSAEAVGGPGRAAPTGSGSAGVPADLEQTLSSVTRLVAPAWPLEDLVAVNPYLGLTTRGMTDALVELEHVAGSPATLPTGWYLDAFDAGRITEADLADVLADAPGARPGGRPDVRAFLDAARADAVAAALAPDPVADERAAAGRPGVPGVADVAARVTGTAWPRLRTDRLSAFAAAYFDGGQAMWRSVDHRAPLYAAWRAEAGVDRTPEILGLRGFRSRVRALPDRPVAAIEALLGELAVPAELLERYLHGQLRRLGGWAALAAQPGWRATAGPLDDDPLVGLLAMLLTWEAAVLGSLRAQGLGDTWTEALAGAPRPDGPARPGVADPLGRRLALHEAFDRAAQRELLTRLAGGASTEPEGSVAATGPARPRAQLVFCIDVRSEILRRHLETVAPDVETLGFAGFFGIAVEQVPLGHDAGVAQCPVLLDPAHRVGTVVAGDDADRSATRAAARRRRGAHVRRRSWKSFKMGAVSCFSFVGPVGLAYLPKLVADSLGRGRPVADPATEGLGGLSRFALRPDLGPGASGAGIGPEVRLDLAERLLRGLSLTDGFAPVVVLTGHRSTTVNNPFAAALDCGACGGHGGDPNARLAAAILNDPVVRAGLPGRGITVPDDTVFVAGVHDTATDDVHLLDLDLFPASRQDEVEHLADDLAAAGQRARAERAVRLGIDPDGDVDHGVRHRSRDWAQVRPEWGLAGCRAFVAAPRQRTRGVDLGGSVFLHSYRWQDDEDFAVLETILTAPVVVASWISLQYYASTVDPERFGSGNKTLHNVVGKIGVLEGNGGDLRLGLPWQSVHDGTRHQHEPVRLSVIVEAPHDAIEAVLDAHPGVGDLFRNGWLHLLVMDAEGRVTHRYGAAGWEPIA